MQLSWRGVNALLVATSTVMFAAEAHLIAYTPLQLRELGLSDVEVGVWTGGLVFPLLAAAVVGQGIGAAFAVGALGYAASFAAGLKLGRTR